MNLSSKQLAKFWAVYAAAESEQLSASASRVDRDTFRHSLILRATGFISLKDVGTGKDFDRLMLEVAVQANDFVEAAYWSTGKERRFVAMCDACIRQIGEITQVPKPKEYLVGLFGQAKLPESWEDIPVTKLAAVFQMLDTYRRRLLSRDFGWSGTVDGQPLGFNPDRVYIRSGGHVDYIDGLPEPHKQSA